MASATSAAVSPSQQKPSPGRVSQSRRAMWTERAKAPFTEVQRLCHSKNKWKNIVSLLQQMRTAQGILVLKHQEMVLKPDGNKSKWFLGCLGLYVLHCTCSRQVGTFFLEITEGGNEDLIKECGKTLVKEDTAELNYLRFKTGFVQFMIFSGMIFHLICKGRWCWLATQGQSNPTSHDRN